ncbi:MAG TPA: DUF4262 domain-containing protein [Planctomycetota bacterium]|nr:DUF4262 domain-containing protein [Planctomycetota bacterium]
MRARTDDLPDSDKQLLDDVEQYGVHVVHVPAELGGGGFSFTVGLWHNFEQPEVIVFGLPDEVAHDLLNAVADEADEGRRFLADSRHEGLLENYSVRFLAVPRSAYADHFGAASWAYEGEEFPAVQLVWPDKQGRWPWDAEAREAFRCGQPVLGTRESRA